MNEKLEQISSNWRHLILVPLMLYTTTAGIPPNHHKLNFKCETKAVVSPLGIEAEVISGIREFRRFLEQLELPEYKIRKTIENPKIEITHYQKCY